MLNEKGFPRESKKINKNRVGFSRGNPIKFEI